MTSNKKQLTYERLNEPLDYNPETGEFIWKSPNNRRVRVGAVAGTLGHMGYCIITIDGKHYRAHRLAWLYVNGYTPENGVDHINRVKNDNRICNLREVSQQCNIRNSKRACTNTSGVCGVVWHHIKAKMNLEI